jgi:hypothetical protein
MTAGIREIPDPNESNNDIIDHGAVVPFLVAITQVGSEAFMPRSE